MSAPNSTIKKKALRVFGDVLADEPENSLTYSPSPRKELAAKSLSPLLESSVDESSKVSSSVNNTSSMYENGKENSDSQRIESVRSPVMKRSPLRRDLVKKTQEAINKAAISVNHSLLAARKAKEESFRQKSQQTAKIRNQWKNNTKEALEFTRHAEQSRRQILEMQRQLSFNYSRERAQKAQNHRNETLQRLEEESQFNSEVFRDHQFKLKEQMDSKRRQSIEARAKVRENNRVGALKMRLEQINEEKTILNERHESSIAFRETKKANAKQRRDSFVFRNGDARRIRELFLTMQAKRKQKEEQSYELKRQAEKDAEEYKKQMEKERRESLAMRNKVSREQWEAAEKNRRVALQMEHESYELKWAGEKDAENYKRQMDEERRQSFIRRNISAKNQRNEEKRLQSEANEAEHESYELKWAGEKDAEMYRKQLCEERRKSLAFRNQEGTTHRKIESDLRSKDLENEQQSLQLKLDGQKDADEYKRKMAEQRRMSLRGRGLEAQRQRLEALQLRLEASSNEQKSYEMKWAGEKDAEEYKRQQERERRQSLAGRNKERANHAFVMQELAAIAREKEAESYILKWSGEKDAKEYLAKCAEERRESLRQRGKQKQHHRMVEIEQKFEALQNLHEEESIRAANRKDVENYQKECAERDRKSLEFRRKEARVQSIREEEQRVIERNKDEKNFELESDARRDVEEYIKDCEKRRRLSLVCRAKEKRRHARWQQEQHEKQLDEQASRVHDNLMDQRYVELARQQERAQLALDALKHKGFKCGDPFGHLL